MYLQRTNVNAFDKEEFREFLKEKMIIQNQNLPFHTLGNRRNFIQFNSFKIYTISLHVYKILSNYKSILNYIP